MEKCERCGNPNGNIMLNGHTLCGKCAQKYHLEQVKNDNRFFGNEHFENAAKEILAGLKSMGFTLDEDNFADTPKRFARAYSEIFEGCGNTEEKVKNILSATFPTNGNDTMVVAENITCFSMCPHHLLPVEYHVCVGYIPKKNGNVVGISKLARLVEVLAKRPMLQETFTREIVDSMEKLGIKGAIAIVEGQHMCMRMRGAKAITSTINTSAITGQFDIPAVRQEFLNIVNSRKKFNA